MVAQCLRLNVKVASQLRRTKVKNTKRTHETPDGRARILCSFNRANPIPRTNTSGAFPTTYTLRPPPPHDAHLPILRHQLPFNPHNTLIISTLSLCLKRDGISGLVRHLPPRAPYGDGIRCYTTPAAAFRRWNRSSPWHSSPDLCPSRRTGLQTCSSGPTIGHTIPILGRPTALKLLFLMPCGPAIRMLR
jgi:hypothetical protein